MLYWYSARVLSVYDADTIRVDIDLGFKSHICNEPIRLARINAPEVRGDEREAGLRARDALRDVILDRKVILNTFKDKRGKYGRWLADVYLPDDLAHCFITQYSVNDWLVANGFAVFKEY